MILSQRTFNTELRLLHTHDGMVLSVDDLGQFNTDHDVMESVFEIQRRLQSLHLSDEENCVLSAFCVVFTGAFHLSHIIHDMSTLVILSLLRIPSRTIRDMSTLVILSLLRLMYNTRHVYTGHSQSASPHVQYTTCLHWSFSVSFIFPNNYPTMLCTVIVF